MRGLQDKLLLERTEAERKAWDALARYKFWMFGYWAARVVQITQSLGDREPNPFRDLVERARRVREHGNG